MKRKKTITEQVEDVFRDAQRRGSRKQQIIREKNPLWHPENKRKEI